MSGDTSAPSGLLNLSQEENDEVELYLSRGRASRKEAFPRIVGSLYSEVMANTSISNVLQDSEAEEELFERTTAYQTLSEEFEVSNKVLETDLRSEFVKKISRYGIEHTRNTTVPAYTMTRFTDFPAEIRVRIWFFMARLREPKLHTFVHDDDWYDHVFERNPLHSTMSRWVRPTFRAVDYNRGSMLLNLPDKHFGQESDIPKCLQICKESRIETMKLLIKLPKVHGLWYRYSLNNVGSETYYSALDDSFYFGSAPSWACHVVLSHLMMEFYTTIPLSEAAHLRLQDVKKMQNLVVDIHIFMALPVRIWAEFSRLKDFVITFYPLKDLGEELMQYILPNAPPPTLKSPRMQGPYGPRAALILDHTRKSFEKLSQELPLWTAPKISVKLITDRLVGDSVWGVDEDAFIEESDGNEPAEADENNSALDTENMYDDDYAMDDIYDDTIYLNQLRERMDHDGYEATDQFPWIEEIDMAHEKLSRQGSGSATS